MAKVSIEWEHNVPENVKNIIQELTEKLWDASWTAVQTIKWESYPQTPLDTGTLRRSWNDEPLKDEIGFRFGYYTKYAARLHEHPEYHFRTPGTKAKYLEHPIERNLGDWQGAFLTKLREIKFK